MGKKSCEPSIVRQSASAIVTEHLAYLGENSDGVLIGGGLRPLPEEPFVGGLWIVEAATYDAVVSLVTNDPYFNPACRQFKILAWGKAFDKPVIL